LPLLASVGAAEGGCDFSAFEEGTAFCPWNSPWGGSDWRPARRAGPCLHQSRGAPHAHDCGTERATSTCASGCAIRAGPPTAPCLSCSRRPQTCAGVAIATTSSDRTAGPVRGPSRACRRPRHRGGRLDQPNPFDSTRFQMLSSGCSQNRRKNQVRQCCRLAQLCLFWSRKRETALLCEYVWSKCKTHELGHSPS